MHKSRVPNSNHQYKKKNNVTYSNLLLISHTNFVIHSNTTNYIKCIHTHTHKLTSLIHQHTVCSFELSRAISIHIWLLCCEFFHLFLSCILFIQFGFFFCISQKKKPTHTYFSESLRDEREK